MNLIIDIEADGLINPKNIWVIVCKDIETNQVYVFRNVNKDEKSREDFLELARKAKSFIGHNIIDFDLPVLNSVIGFSLDSSYQRAIDTLIVSKLVDYSRKGHSLADYGEELGSPKSTFTDWSCWSQDLENRCIQDVHINHKVYDKYASIIHSPEWQASLDLEHQFQHIVNSLRNNGFYFNSYRAKQLLERVEKELGELDVKILNTFVPKLSPVKEVTPKLTKHGTLNRSDFRWLKDADLSEYNGGPFTRCIWKDFNPSSHKQIVDVLHAVGWKPTDKTKTHIELERELKKLERTLGSFDVRVQECYAKLQSLSKYGFKINETNLNTLPESAPSPARTLAKRILLESRRRTLTEWLGLVNPDTGRIHGTFYGIGAWTHRMAHQKPNTANIPTEAKLFGSEMRSLWCAPPRRLLVGVDAESIQLRIFAHYIDDEEFTFSLVQGKKDDKTDPHSLNQRILGSVCQHRNVAKRFIYALLLGAGIPKLAEILGCSREEAEDALNRILERYTGFATLKQSIIPKDASLGYFVGLDGRKVRIPGENEGTRKHLAMSGYLQNGEAVVMKKASVLWHQALLAEKFDNEIKQRHWNTWKIVNFVHDEWQTEVSNDFELALRVAQIQADCLRLAGEQLKLKCPLAGSYWNEDHKDYTIGTNWSVTH